MSMVIKMNGYERRTESKKRAIIDAARELFAQYGYSDVSINDIAEESGISHVSIYNYFGDKKSLAVQVLASFLDEAIKEYELILDRDMPFAEKLQQIMDLKTDKIEQTTHSFFSSLAWDDKAFQQVYQEAAYDKAIPIYTRFIELGKKDGAIDPTIPTDAILAYILQVMPLLQHKDYLKTPADYKQGLFKLFLYGIVGHD